MSTHTRKSLTDVLGGSSRDELARQYAEAEAAGDMVTLPRGTYRCRVTDGELVESKGGTPGYTLTFTVDAGEHKGRKLWHTAWLTPAALPMTKRDLSKFGVLSLDALESPLPPGFVVDVKVVLRADDDGTERNRVVSFDVVAVLADPTADADFGSPMSPSPATALSTPPVDAGPAAATRPAPERTPAVGRYLPGQLVLPCVEPPAGGAA